MHWLLSIAQGCLWIFFSVSALAQNPSPRILLISPTSGPEGSRVEITGDHLQGVTSVSFGKSSASFKVISPEKLTALVPRWVSHAPITAGTAHGQASSAIDFLVQNDPRVPDDVGWKGGYVNPVGAPWPFHSVLLWGIAIADTRVPGYQSAQIEIASTRLTCRIDGKDVVLTGDAGEIRGGLYLRHPWFGSANSHEPLPLAYDNEHHTVIMHVGQRTDCVWHFWPPSPRPAIPPGKLEGCTVKARVRISPGALLQMGMDYWRGPTVPWSGSDGNNHEAGASNWYLPSAEWQEATFTDIGGPQF